MRRTRGEYEDAFTKAIIKFEKEHLGRGPLNARSYFLDDLILVRLQGTLTPAEALLAESHDGQTLIKETRRKLHMVSVPIIERIVQDVLGCALINMYTDMNTQTGERVIVLTVDINLTERFA